jgi:hypothetical protein
MLSFTSRESPAAPCITPHHIIFRTEPEHLEISKGLPNLPCGYQTTLYTSLVFDRSRFEIKPPLDPPDYPPHQHQHLHHRLTTSQIFTLQSLQLLQSPQNNHIHHAVLYSFPLRCRSPPHRLCCSLTSPSCWAHLWHSRYQNWRSIRQRRSEYAEHFLLRWRKRSEHKVGDCRCRPELPLRRSRTDDSVEQPSMWKLLQHHIPGKDYEDYLRHRN